MKRSPQRQTRLRTATHGGAQRAVLTLITTKLASYPVIAPAKVIEQSMIGAELLEQAGKLIALPDFFQDGSGEVKKPGFHDGLRCLREAQDRPLGKRPSNDYKGASRNLRLSFAA
jgi:hypothetical protein